jgi:hypothetical protein
MQWFVQPKVDRLPLPDGQWVDVKRELSRGDEDGVFEASSRPMDDGRFVANPGAYRRARVLAYLHAWSFDVEVTAAAVANLTPEAFEAIRTALDAHEAAVDAEKNGAATPSA